MSLYYCQQGLVSIHCKYLSAIEVEITEMYFIVVKFTKEKLNCDHFAFIFDYFTAIFFIFLYYIV